MAEEDIHWKKNNDSKYISGEDLHESLSGMRPEMDVVLVGFEDVETFDRNENKTLTKTGMYFKDLKTGKNLSKAMILNDGNAQEMTKIHRTPYMNRWLKDGLKVTLFAQADKRFDWVARIKKTPVRNNTDPKPILEAMKKCKDKAALQAFWIKLKPNENTLPEVVALKEELKAKLK